MAFTQNEGERITLEEAKTLVGSYRKAHDLSVVRSHFVGRTILEAILAQQGCVGVRALYGLDDSGQKQLILVGVNSDETNQLTGIIADRFPPCPPSCSVKDELSE